MRYYATMLWIVRVSLRGHHRKGLGTLGVNSPPLTPPSISHSQSLLNNLPSKGNRQRVSVSKRGARRVISNYSEMERLDKRRRRRGSFVEGGWFRWVAEMQACHRYTYFKYSIFMMGHWTSGINITAVIAGSRKTRVINSFSNCSERAKYFFRDNHTELGMNVRQALRWYIPDET